MATSDYRANAQLTTLEAGPRNRGEEWSGEDVAMLMEFGDITALELALALGRTEYGVENARQRLLAGETLGGGSTASVRPLSNRVYTFIGDDCPPGWRD